MPHSQIILNKYLVLANPEIAISTSSFLVGLGLLIVSTEDLISFRLFSQSGLLNWEVSKLRLALKVKRPLFKILSRVYGQYFLYFLFIKWVFAILLLVMGLFHTYSPFVFGACLSILLLETLRSPFGQDGAHQMSTIVLGALFISSIGLAINKKIFLLGCFISSFQLLLAYATAGWFKFRSKEWRTGQALSGIFRTRAYGNLMVYRILNRYPRVGYFLSWGTILFLLLFPALIWIPNPNIKICLLIGGFLFHLSNAFLMGLGPFFFAFVSTYPLLITFFQAFS